MAIKVPNGGELLLLDALLTYLGTLTLRLYKNNYTPVDASVAGDFTEANFDGYAGIALSSWGTPATDGSGNALVQHDTLIFQPTGSGVSNTIYGYYVTEPGGAIVYAELNPAGGQVVGTPADLYPVVPRFSLTSAA